MHNKCYLLIVFILAMNIVGCNQKNVSEIVSEEIVVNENSNVGDILEQTTDENEEMSNINEEVVEVEKDIYLTYFIDGEKQIDIAKRINGEIYVPLINTFNKFRFTVDLREDSKGKYYIFERTDGITQEIRVYINGLYFSLGDGSNPETFYDLNVDALLEEMGYIISN